MENGRFRDSESDKTDLLELFLAEDYLSYKTGFPDGIEHLLIDNVSLF